MSESENPRLEPAPPRSRRLVLFAVFIALSLGLDLATKAWAWEALQNRPGIVLKEGVLVLDFAFNTGSAFGLLADAEWARTFFIIVTLAAFGYLVQLVRKLPTRWPSGFVAVGLIAGGALGNLHDRLFRIKPLKTYLSEITFGDLLSNAEVVSQALVDTRHYVELHRYGVVDFIVVYYWPHRRWPAFNVADVSLCAGVGLFMLYLHRHGADEDMAETGKAEA
jgi:signal peptidase II